MYEFSSAKNVDAQNITRREEEGGRRKRREEDGEGRRREEAEGGVSNVRRGLRASWAATR